MMKHIDLLYFSSKEKSHYALIKNLSRLTKSQLYKRKCKTYPCKRCLNSFHTKERLNQHSKYCYGCGNLQYTRKVLILDISISSCVVSPHPLFRGNMCDSSGLRRFELAIFLFSIVILCERS